MTDAPRGPSSAADLDGGSTPDQPDVDEVREWLERVGDDRPSVEPDLHAIVDRAGQRIFRRRIGTGLALLGLIVPGVALAPSIGSTFTTGQTETTVQAEVEPVVVVDERRGVLATVSECRVEAVRLRANFGSCRYL